MDNITQGKVEASAGEVRYDPKKLAILRAHYQKRIDSGKLQAASFLMARRGKVFAHEAMGRLTYQAGAGPLRSDSIHSIASVSKVFTATAVMMLCEEGRVWLDQPVKELLREFDTPMHGEIRIRHLLTHTSGLMADLGYFTEPYPLEGEGVEERDDWLVKRVLCGPVQSRPGERWSYCTGAFLALAEIVSRVSGKHFHDFVQDEIFRPLGMSRSFLEVPEPLWPEVCRRGDWEQQQIASARARKGVPRGGGGVYSTLHDLFKFGQCFLQGGEYAGARILGKKTVREMTRNQLSGVPAFHWGKKLTDYRQGLGWAFFCDGSTVGPETYNHDGWGWCGLFVDPVEEFIFAFFVPDPNDWNADLVVTPRTIAFSGIL